jgi:hypothetical protein
MADSRLRIILSLKDQASAGLKKVGRQITQVGREAEKAEKATGGFSLKTAALGLVSIQTARKMAALTKESILLAARFETMGVVVNNLGKNVGVSSTEMRRLERSLEETGISMIGARESIARLIQADIDLAHATDLARVAQDGAVIAGTNSTAAFEKLVGFISTGNIRVARQIGLFIDLRTAYKEFAQANDRTVASLTEQEKTQIRANAAVKAGSQITGTYEAAMETAGKQLGSLERDVENFKVTFGTLFNKTMAEGVPMTRKLFQGLTASLEMLMNMNDAAFVLGQEVTGLRHGMLELADGTRITTDEFQMLHEQWSLQKEDAILVAESFDKAKTAISELEPPPDVAESVGFLEKKFAGVREQIDIANSASQNLWGNMNTGITGSIDKLQEQIDFMQAGGTGVQAAFENVQSALSAGLIAPEEAEAALREIELAAIAVEEEVGNIDMNEAIRQVRDEYNVSWQRAKQLISEAKQFVDSIPARTEKKIEFFVEYTGAGLPGFQHGGSFVVGGQGGADSQMVAFRATPGERVTIDNSSQSQNFGPFNMSSEIDGQALIEQLKTVVRRS